LACGTERIILLAGESSLVEQWVVVVMVKVGIAPKTSRRKLSFLPCDLTYYILQHYILKNTLSFFMAYES
jgi:hypothetical protein